MGRWGRALVAAALAVTSMVGGPGNAAAAQAYPGYTLSHYVQNSISASAFYSSGCSQGRISVGNGIVVLDFGQPWVSSGTYGARYWYYGGVAFLSTTAIATYVQGFGQGFYDCSPATSYLRLAVGVNNDSGYVTSGHGSAWSAMVGAINAWLVARGYSGRVTAAGAIDAEPGFAARAPAVRAWMTGFGTSWLAYDFGSADGCSWTSYAPPPGLACNNGWRQDDLYYLAWGAPAGWGLPEVYATGTLTLPNGAPSNWMANQWEMVRLYGARYGSLGAAVIAGQMAQTDSLSPQTSWTYLYNSVNAYSPVQGNVRWSTKIVWGL